MTAPIGFSPSVGSVTSEPSVSLPSPRGRASVANRAPVPFDTLTLPQYDQLRDKLLTTRLETLQDWAQKEFPKFQAPPRQAWLDLYTRTLLEIIREKRPASKELDQLLLEMYPSSHGFRIADTAIAGIQRLLDEALAQPQPDAKQIKIWFTLLIEQEKVDIDRHRYQMKPPASKLTEIEIRRDIFNILGFPQSEQDRIESEIAADRAQVAPSGRTDVSSVPAGVPPAASSTEPAFDHPSAPTDLLGQTLASSTHPSIPAHPAHPFSTYMPTPADPSPASIPSISSIASQASHPTQKTEGGCQASERILNPPSNTKLS